MPPNAPNGFNVEGLTMAPGSQSVAWFGLRVPTITGADGVERAAILPVDNLDKLTANSVNAELGQPIFLDLGGRSGAPCVASPGCSAPASVE